MNPFISVFIIFLTSLFSQLNSVAQLNLVPNPSFEIHDSCPSFHSQISKAIGWSGYQVTPDYYHKCATNWLASVPRNLGGYQDPISIDDSSYVGVITSIDGNGLHEIFGIELVEPLMIGQRYYVSFYISAGSGTHSLCYCNKFGVKFITYLSNLGSSNPDLINNFAHLFEDSIISDTSSWKLFKKSFIADSAYTGILLGNFFVSTDIDYTCWTTGFKSTYNYIDKICVTVDSNYCAFFNNVNEQSNHNEEFDISIEDNHIRLNFKRNDTSLKFYIFDLAGRVVMERNVHFGINNINYFHLSSGLYLIYFNNKVYKFIR